MDTITLDKNKIVKESIKFFLAQEESLKTQWLSSVGSDKEKDNLFEYLTKRKLISEMIDRLLKNM